MATASIDTFENPFLGMEGKIKKNLGETDDATQLVSNAEREQNDGEQQMYETFVKEKTTLLSYIHDLIRFAAKSQQIDVSGILASQQTQEESKGAAATSEEALRIKNTRECCIMTARVNDVVSTHSYRDFYSHSANPFCLCVYQLEKYQEQSSVLDPILDPFVTPMMHFLQLYVRKAVAE